MTKLRIMFVIEQNDASNEQIAACAGFANAMGLTMTIVPEAGPKKERLRWSKNASRLMDPKEAKTVGEVLASIVGPDGAVTRKDLVNALAAKLRKKTRDTGKLVAKWTREGILEEVE